jgi:hypothetical protein
VSQAIDVDLTTALIVFMLAAFLGLNVILPVSRLLHAPLLSLPHAIREGVGA